MKSKNDIISICEKISTLIELELIDCIQFTINSSEIDYILAEKIPSIQIRYGIVYLVSDIELINPIYITYKIQPVRPTKCEKITMSSFIDNKSILNLFIPLNDKNISMIEEVYSKL